MPHGLRLASVLGFSLSEPITELQIRSEHIRMLLTERVRLNLGWSALQIAVALVHICAICSTGMRTNEEVVAILVTRFTDCGFFRAKNCLRLDEENSQCGAYNSTGCECRLG